jgi:hypothetical protein
VSQYTCSFKLFCVSDGNIQHRVVARCPSIPSAVILACNKCCLRIYTTVSLLSLSINTSPSLTQGCSTAFWGGQQNVATLVSSREVNKCCCCFLFLSLSLSNEACVSDCEQQDGIRDGSLGRTKSVSKRFV